jgi:hypothetical protein
MRVVLAVLSGELTIAEAAEATRHDWEDGRGVARPVPGSGSGWAGEHDAGPGRCLIGPRSTTPRALSPTATRRSPRTVSSNQVSTNGALSPSPRR